MGKWLVVGWLVVGGSVVSEFNKTHEKTYLTVHFTKAKGCLFCQVIDRKVTGLGSNYYLLAGDTSQVSIFFLHKIKMNKQHRLFIL